MPVPTEEELKRMVDQLVREEAHKSIIPRGLLGMPVIKPPSANGLMDAMAYAAGAHAHTITPSKTPKTPKQMAMMGRYNHTSRDEDFFIQLLVMRMRVKEGEALPVDFISIFHDIGSGNVHMMIVKNDTSVTFKEEASIFPSDQTIAQLHLIIAK